MSILTFGGVALGYEKDVNVLDGIDLDVARGHVVGLLGRNGAGKTTLIRLAMGMLVPDVGDVRVFDLDPRVSSVEVKRRTGYVAEDQELPPFLSVEEVIAFHRHLYPSWDEDLCTRLASQFRITPHAKIKNLSKGQARQVALLCAVSHRPELLLLDEPAGSLDPSTRREFLETAIELLNDSGTTIVFSSHHMTDVERMANQIVMIHEGHILIDRDLDEIREGYWLAVVASERSAAFWQQELDCLCIRRQGGTIRMVLDGDRDRVMTRLDGTPARLSHIGLEDLFIEIAGSTP